MATLKKLGEQQYVALNRHDINYFSGTLKEIMDEMEGDADDVDNYKFYELGRPIGVELKKELILKSELVVTR